MSNDITVIVATCGSNEWEQLGNQAVLTIPAGTPTIRVHLPHGSVASSRNEGLLQVNTELVLWLDADDSLTPGYIDIMQQGEADIRQPYVKGWGAYGPPQCWHHGPPHAGRRECLKYGNPLSLGAAIRTQLALDNPWDPKWPVLEDYAFWRTICANPQVTVESLPATYITRTRRNPNPRNQSLPRKRWEDIGKQITQAIPFP